MCTCKCIYRYKCTYMDMCIYICVNIYAHVYTHTSWQVVLRAQIRELALLTTNMLLPQGLRLLEDGALLSLCLCPNARAPDLLRAYLLNDCMMEWWILLRGRFQSCRSKASEIPVPSLPADPVPSPASIIFLRNIFCKTALIYWSFSPFIFRSQISFASLMLRQRSPFLKFIV